MDLETLYVQIKLETDGLNKQVAESRKRIDSLQTGFESMSRAGDKVSESFRGVARSAVGMFAGFASVSALLRGANGAVAAIRDVGQASRELQVDVSALDAWGHAVQRTGGSAQAFQSSLRGLAQHLGTTADVAMRALPRLADAFARLNPRQSMIYGKSLGLDTSTIMLLQQGRREVESVIRQQQKLGVVTKEQADITRRYDNALYDASRAYQTFFRELAVPMLPGITRGLEYMIEHKDAVADAFKAMAVGAGVLSAVLLRMSGPLGIAVAGISALSVAYGAVKEDITAFKNHRESLLGDVLGVKRGPIKDAKQLTDNLRGQYTGNALLAIPGQIFSGIGKMFGLGGGASNSTSTVSIENVNINTAATDADGIAAAARGGLQRELAQLTSHVDNGVRI